MAERRYGFRFSFAEGCVIVASLCGASFLIFMFGIYAGRELEARKAAEHTNLVRLTVPHEGEFRGPSPGEKASKDGQEKPHPPAVSPEPPKTVVVLNPPSRNETPTVPDLAANLPTPPAPSPPSVKEAEVKVATPPKSPVVSEDRKLPLPSTPPVQRIQEKSQPPKEATSVQASKKLQSTGGRWSVQIHATRDEEAARQLATQLRSQGYAPAISKVVRDGEVWYRVRVGSFANANEARSSVGALRKNRKFSQAYPVSN